MLLKPVHFFFIWLKNILHYNYKMTFYEFTFNINANMLFLRFSNQVYKTLSFIEWVLSDFWCIRSASLRIRHIVIRKTLEQNMKI